MLDNNSIAGFSATSRNLRVFIIKSCKKRMDVISIISYEPLWNTLRKKHITQYQLIREYNFSTGTLDALRKNKSITLNTLHDICEMLNCEISDVVIGRSKY